MTTYRRILPALALALATVAAPAAAQVAGALPGTGPGRGSPLLEPEALRSHVEHLAGDALAGRRAGTPGAERAAAYVVRAFQDSGLQPPPGEASYLDPFEFAVGVEPGPDTRLVLHKGSRLVTIFSAGRDFLPLAGSLPDRVVESVVFVGYGISAPSIGYDDYAGVDVRGKVALALRWGPQGDDPASRFGRYLSERHKAATARDKGARAILFVNPPATEAIDRLIPFSPDADPQELGVVALSVTQEVAQRIVATDGGDLAGWQRAIDQSQRPHSRVLPAVLNLRADLRPRTRTTHNVIGVIPGRNPARAREVVVIGAHYDGLGLGGAGSLDPVPGEIHNGADDNASGVAALLELAQFFAYPTNRPDRTLVFVAFGAEEEGMLGSAKFVSDPPVPLPDIVAMINLDMIGRLEEELVVYGVGSSRAWTEALESGSAELGLPLKLMGEGYGPSDHAAFYLRHIPVLAFFTGVHADYHRSTDDPERIDLEGLYRVTRLVRHVVARVANAPSRPAFDPTDFSPRQIAPVEAPERARVRLGAVPAAAGPDEHVLLEAVIEGSPADQAGLRAGDRVVRLGGRAVVSIYDYLRALGELEPDRSARIVVERDGARVQATIVPAPSPLVEEPPKLPGRP